MKYLIVLILLFTSMFSSGQSELPYYEIPAHPTEYTPGAVAARLIDGLGFRYYWATDSLSEQDLQYKPSADARTAFETLVHIHEMSLMIFNAAKNEVNQRSDETLSFEQMRAATLNNLKQASDLLKLDGDLSTKKLRFEGRNGETSYEFWYHLNGPIADCIWHVGQIVSFRRASGNPISDKLSFFNGKVRQ